MSELYTYTLLNGVKETGVGSSQDIETMQEKFTCWITLAGTAPTSVTVALEGSIDGITWAPLATNTYTVASSDTAMFHVVNKGVAKIRGNYTAKVGGDTTTAVTFKVHAYIS